MNKINYVTKRAHENYPSGSKCLASREFGVLILEFEDGNVIKYPGYKFYLEGIEPQPKSHYYDKLVESIAKEIDEEILGELFRSVKEK